MPLYMYVGKMRQGKSYCAVSKIDEITKENSDNLEFNRKIFQEHLNFFTDRGESDLLESFMKLLDCEQYPEYHEELKVPFNEFLSKYNEENKLKLTLLKPVRQIYTDINGVIEIGKIKNVLPAPDDWRITPKGSIIFYDEFQIHRPAFKFDGNKLSKDQMIIDISTIGHSDKDLYLITQDAENLNFSLRKLIDKMYFVKRPPQNIQACSVYTFDCFLKNPKAAAESTRKPYKYISWEIVRYNNYIYSLYKSASSHDSVKRKLPLKLFIWAFIIIAVISGVIYGLTHSPIFAYVGQAIKMMSHSNLNSISDMTKSNTTVPQPHKTSTTTTTSTTNSSVQHINLDTECRKSENLNKKECVDWYNDLTKNKDSVQSASYNSSSQTVSYDPSDPYNDKDIKSKLQYTVTSQPKFSGCMKTSSGYRAYTEQGTYLKTSKSVCNRLMHDSSDRPYDYFRQTVQGNQSSLQAQSDTLDKKKTDKDQTENPTRVYNIPETNDTFNNPKGI